MEELVAPDVVNTMPEETLRAFADHGDASRDFSATPARRRRPCGGPGRPDSTSPPSRPRSNARAYASFCDSYRELLERIESKLRDDALADAIRR